MGFQAFGPKTVFISHDLDKKYGRLMGQPQAWAYIRVSTKEQDEEVQRKAIEDFCTSRAITLTKIFIDKGESGGKPFQERPSAKQLLDELAV
ncbi:MAG: recombinase family protein, partial [Thermosphaera sp.]